MSLIETIKSICVDTVKSTKPVEVTFGTVSSTSPLKVKIDQRLLLSEQQLIMNNYTPSDFKAGEWVILLRIQGGKKYLILSKQMGEENGSM